MNEYAFYARKWQLYVVYIPVWAVCVSWCQENVSMSCLTRLKTAFQSTSCWGDSWRRVLPWQLLSHLSRSCLRVRLRFMASCSSLDAASTAGCVHLFLRHICGPCRPGRGRAQTQPFGDPPMWQKQVKCDFLAQTHLLSGRERRWAIFMQSADCYECMHETVMQRSVRDIMYHIVSHVRYSHVR